MNPCDSPFATLLNAVHWTESNKLMSEMRVGIEDQYTDGCTLLHIACKHGRLELAKFLWMNGASIHVTDNNGWTPLHWACKNGHVDLVAWLVSCGANVNLKDKPEGNTALHVACANDKLGVVAWLVTAGADLNQTDSDGWTPLHLAYHKGCLNVARWLVSHGEKIHAAENTHGLTPPHLTCRNNDLETAKWLVSPVQLGCLNKEFEFAQRLVKQGPNVHYTDNADRNLDADQHQALRISKEKVQEKEFLESDLIIKIEAPSQSDVLSGKGQPINQHPGNIKFRSLISSTLNDYIGANKKDKARMTWNVVAQIKSKGGRFLKKHEDDWWAEISDKEARGKVGKAFVAQSEAIKKKKLDSSSGLHRQHCARLSKNS